jgi:hypothetical protein
MIALIFLLPTFSLILLCGWIAYLEHIETLLDKKLKHEKDLSRKEKAE